MADNPDLSKIVSLIMEHPEIVGQISALLASSGAGGESPTEAEITVESTEASEASVPPVSPVPRHRSDRARLLGAMKPYLSKNRAQAVDTMITVTDILESMRKGG